MKPPLKRLIPLLVIAGLVAGGYFLDRSRADKRTSLTGTFESQPSRLAPKTTGRVADISVHEGEAVKAGQVLVRLRAPEVAFDTAAAQAQARQAEAKSEEAKAGSRKEEIRRQQAVVAESEAGLRKLVNGPLPEEIASASHKMEEARARYLLLRRGSRTEDISQAREAAREALARLEAVRRGPNEEERRQLQAQLRAAESDLRLASVEYDRKRWLGQQGAIAGVQADIARNAYEKAQANRDAAAQALRRAELGAPLEERRQAEAAYRQARARLAEVEAGPRKEEIAAAAAQLQAAQANLRLVQRGSRQEDLAAAKARLDANLAALAELEAGSRKEAVAQAQAAARAAQAQAASVGQRKDELVVRAPKDGVVERVLVALGDLSGPTAPVVQFSDPTDIWLRVYVPESILATVSPGTAATLRVDGVADPVEAVVESVSTQGEFTPANLQTPEERGKQVFAVRLTLRNKDKRIKAGMAASVVRFGSGK